MISETDTQFLNLLPKVNYNAPTTFLQYTFQSCNIMEVEHEGQLKLQVTITLRRNIGMIFLVTYLPTLLMNIINQSSNYLRSNENDRLGDIIKVNITSMMVL